MAITTGIRQSLLMFFSFFSYSGIGTSYWIGATDIVEEGTYIWTDGSEVQMGAPFWGPVSIYISQKMP